MQYVAILDYEHLDNALFLKSFAESLAAQQNTRGIILHGDSVYTERLIQTGMMRENAKERSIKDLNHRLVSLLADSGVASIGVNAFQRDIIRYDGTSFEFDKSFLNGFPGGTHLVLSTLINDTRNQNPAPFSISELAVRLHKQLSLDEIIVFSKNEADEIMVGSPKPDIINLKDKDQAFLTDYIPDELHTMAVPIRLVTAREFRRI